MHFELEIELLNVGGAYNVFKTQIELQTPAW